MSDFAEGLATGMNTNNNEMGNGAWWWIIILFALWGNNGNWGNNGGQQMGYELGRVATTNDVASGLQVAQH